MVYKVKRWMSGLAVLLLLMPFASAFGVSSSYFTGNPLIMQPGQTELVILNLQNMLGGEDLTIQAEVLTGQEIASIETDIYMVNFGENDIPVSVTISLPDSAGIGSNYDVQISFKEVAESEGEFVGLSGAVATTIPIVVESAQVVAPQAAFVGPDAGSRSSNFYWILVLMVLTLAVLGYLLYKKR